MHVVQALAALSIGGSEIVSTELTKDLLQRGCRVTVLAAPGPLSPVVAEMGAELLPWPINRKRLGTLRYIRRIRRWLMDERPDVLHVHSRLPALLCWQALKGMPAESRPALVTSIHGHYSISRYSSLMARGDAVIAVSDAIRDYALLNYDVDPARLSVIHGGADREQYPYGYKPDQGWFEQTLAEFPQLKGKRWLCLPGRLSRYKGHADFINLLGELLLEFDDLHGVVIGAGKKGSRFSDELEGLAVSHGIKNRLLFTGVRMDIREWMAASTLVFNLCSDPPEAFGRVVLESLYLGRPVVAWNHGGVAEILSRMYPFGAVPPNNPAALLAQTRAFLTQAPPVPNEDAFPLRVSMDKTWDLYQQVTANRNPPGARP